MQKEAPEITVIVKRVRNNSLKGHYELHLGRIINIRNWDRKHERAKKKIPVIKEEQGAGVSPFFTACCVYTIVDGIKLAYEAKTGGLAQFQERKPWVTAKRLFQEARSKEERMPILFGDATDCSRLRYWGLLTQIRVTNNRTHFAVDRLRQIRNRRTQELVLRSTRKNIARTLSGLTRSA